MCPKHFLLFKRFLVKRFGFYQRPIFCKLVSKTQTRPFFFFFFLKRYYLFIFREREREGEREEEKRYARGKHWPAASCIRSHRVTGPQLRHVPWLGIKLVKFLLRGTDAQTMEPQLSHTGWGKSSVFKVWNR